MHRLASVSALWLLLGFVLGGVAAPVWHTVQHASEAAHAEAHHAPTGHTHADLTPGDLVIGTPDDGEAHPLACALCAVHFTSTTTAAATALMASHATGEVGPVAVSAPRGPTLAPYAPRGPPAS